MRLSSTTTTPEPAKLLVRGLNWLGDAVMSTPALQRLRQRFPHAQITLLVQDALAGLWQSDPCVNSVETFTRTEGPWSLGRRLRGHGFDTALILPNSPRSALEAWLARIPHRVGYGGSWRSCLLTLRPERPAGHSPLRRRSVAEIKRLVQNPQGTISGQGPGYVHQIQDYLRLAAALGANPLPLAPRLELAPGEVPSTLAGLGELLSTGLAPGPDGRPAVWLGICATAAYGPAKRWPLERFGLVAREISARYPGCLWLNFGARQDAEMGEQLAAAGAGTIVNLAGKTTLRQLMVLLSRCRVLLTNDSGPMHVAAALGTPVVVPFGSTSAELTGPGKPGDPQHHLLKAPAPCSPCFRRVCPVDFRCMLGISVSQVVEAVADSLNSRPIHSVRDPPDHPFPRCRGA